MEKLEDRKDFNFSHFYLVESGKVEGRKKKSLYKFTHTTLLKKDGQLKQKSDKKKKKNKRRNDHSIY